MTVLANERSGVDAGRASLLYRCSGVRRARRRSVGLKSYEHKICGILNGLGLGGNWCLGSGGKGYR